MTPRDTRRQQFYDTERAVLALTDRPGGGAQIVQIAGTELTVQAQAKFGSVDAIARYIDDVLAMPAVVDRFPRATRPVRVRNRRSARAAHYTPADHPGADGPAGIAEIAIPASSDDRWAMRELVVLHELAHHLDDSDGPAHGPGFAHTLVELTGLVLGPEVSLVYRVLLTDAGLM